MECRNCIKVKSYGNLGWVFMISSNVGWHKYGKQAEIPGVTTTQKGVRDLHLSVYTLR